MKITEIRFVHKISFPGQEMITYLRSGVHPGTTRNNDMVLLKEGVLVRYRTNDNNWKNQFIPFSNIACLLLEGEVPKESLFEEKKDVVPEEVVVETKKNKNSK